MDSKGIFNKVLGYAVGVNGFISRKDGKYLYDTKLSDKDLYENFLNKEYDYFTIITEDNQLVEYLFLGKAKIQGELNAHKAAKKYTHYKSEEEEDDKFRSAIMKALKNNITFIFKNANDGYKVGKQTNELVKDILLSHYFLYIIGDEIYEFFRFDIRTITHDNNMDLPKL